MATIQGLLKMTPQCVGRLAVDDSKPKYWFTWGNEIKIEPVPDGAYKLALYISDFPAAELTSDTDEPSYLPNEFHECIVYFACYSFLIKRKKWDLASYYYNRYLSSLEKRFKIYMDRKTESRSPKHLPNAVRRN